MANYYTTPVSKYEKFATSPDHTLERHMKYVQHRKRVQNAVSIVDSKAPKKHQPEEKSFTYLEMLEMMNTSKGSPLTFTKQPQSLLIRESNFPRKTSSAPIQSDASYSIGTKHGMQRNQIKNLSPMRWRNADGNARMFRNQKNAPPEKLSKSSNVYNRNLYLKEDNRVKQRTNQREKVTSIRPTRIDLKAIKPLHVPSLKRDIPNNKHNEYSVLRNPNLRVQSPQNLLDIQRRLSMPKNATRQTAFQMPKAEPNLMGRYPVTGLRAQRKPDMAKGNMAQIAPQILRKPVMPKAQPTVAEQKMMSKYDIPTAVFERYRHLLAQSNLTMLRRLLRPKIYFDLEIEGRRALGRLIIQLYTEACPEVVLAFVRTCTSQRQDRISFTRILSPLWFEGKLMLDNNNILTDSAIEHDPNSLNHGAGAGVLSFPSRYVRGSKWRCLTFSISFKPLNVLNGKRIGFGKVMRGQWMLDEIMDHGSPNSNFKGDIVVRKCGVINCF